MEQKMKLGLQLYTLRNFTKTPEDFLSTMEKVAKIGYRYVQVSGVGPDVNAAVIRKAKENTGLEVVITHTPFDKIQNETEKVIEDHASFGCKIIGLGMAPHEYIDSADGYRRFADVIAPAVEKIKAAGMVFSYHNHYHEFAKKNGKHFVEYFIENTDREAVKLTADVYWLHYAGLDECAWLSEHKDRISCTHFKDMGVHEQKQCMIEVMEGNLPYPKILAACRDAGLLYHFVELDETRIDPFEAIEISYRNLKNTGFFEK